MAGAVYATLHTNAGPIRLELFPNHAPKTVRNFVDLAEGNREYTDPRTGQPGSGPYYNGTISHRVISGFMVQMGDPTGTGRGGPGYTFADEFHPELEPARVNQLEKLEVSGMFTNYEVFYFPDLFKEKFLSA